jgi:hypothetical protein
MKLASITKIRIPILLALIVGEIVGLVHFYRTPNFVLFALITLFGTALTASYLWIEWFVEQRINKQNLMFFYPFWVMFGIHEFVRGEVFMIILWIILFLIVISQVIIRLIYPLKTNVNQTEDKGIVYGFTGAEILFAVIFMLSLFLMMWNILVQNRHISFIWSFPFVIPLIVIIWIYFSFRIELKRINQTGNLSILNNDNNQGGRA